MPLYSIHQYATIFYYSDNGKDFGGSIYQKVSDKLDCGVSMRWTSGSSDTLFGVGAKFALENDASLHAKVNNKSLVGLGYQQKLRPGESLPNLSIFSKLPCQYPFKHYDVGLL